MPKRKAPPKLSGLLGSDDEDIMRVETTETQETHEPPTKKRRGRPRTSNENVNETKPTKPATRTRKKQAAAAVAEPEPPANKKPARRGRPRGNSRAAQDAETSAQATEVEDMVSEQEDADNQENEAPLVSKNTKKQPPKAAKAAPARSRGRPGAVSTKFHTDGEFQFTPSDSRHVSFQDPHKEQAETSPLARAASLGGKEPEVEDSQQNEQPAVELVDETIINEEPAHNRKSMSPMKNARSRLSILRHSQDPSPRKRKFGGTDSEQGGDPELRRRLGEMTKKHDALESKYRNLREIGVVEANSNMEKLRKQSEAVTKASNELVISLKAEIDTQRKLGLQSRGLQKQLKDRDDELARLKSSADETQGQLASAQSEVKALQTKLAAARNTAASLEASKVPGSAIKGGAANRANAAATAEAAQASQLAQLKEDLYSDLTGLIVRDVKNRESDYLYDCIQTGINGTLHFHLVVPKASADYDKTEFQYLPHLDPNRDRDLVNLLPDFLAVDITFVRGQAAKFYTRVIDALTKRRSLPAQ